MAILISPPAIDPRAASARTTGTGTGHSAVYRIPWHGGQDLVWAVCADLPEAAEVWQCQPGEADRIEQLLAAQLTMWDCDSTGCPRPLVHALDPDTGTFTADLSLHQHGGRWLLIQMERADDPLVVTARGIWHKYLSTLGEFSAATMTWYADAATAHHAWAAALAERADAAAASAGPFAALAAAHLRKLASATQLRHASAALATAIRSLPAEITKGRQRELAYRLGMHPSYYYRLAAGNAAS
jgi:hypothetical protein